MHTLSRGPTQDTHTHPFRSKIDVQPKPSANSGFVLFVCCSVAYTHRCFSVDVFCFNVRIFMSILFMYIFGFEAEYDFVCVVFLRAGWQTERQSLVVEVLIFCWQIIIACTRPPHQNIDATTANEEYQYCWNVCGYTQRHSWHMKTYRSESKNYAYVVINHKLVLVRAYNVWRVVVVGVDLNERKKTTNV